MSAGHAVGPIHATPLPRWPKTSRPYGEQYNQPAITGLCRCASIGEHDGIPLYPAVLAPYPPTDFDHNPVAVIGPTGLLGVVHNQRAAKMRPKIDRLAAQGEWIAVWVCLRPPTPNAIHGEIPIDVYWPTEAHT